MSRGAGRLMPPGGADPPLDGQTPVYEPTGADPRVTPGLDRPPGSIARFGVSTYLWKTGTAATQWGTFGGAGIGGLGAGTQTATSGTLVFANSNGVSFGLSGSSQITASVIPTLSIQIQDATGTVNFVLSSGGMTFVNNASGAKFGTSALGGGSVGISAKTLSTVSYMVNNGYDRGVFVGGISVGTLHLAPFRADNFISATRMDMIWDVANVSSAGATVSQLLGLYTMSGSTIGIVSTASRSWGYNSTAASSSFTQISGTRYRSMSLAGGTWFLTPGDYILGAMFTISTSQSSGTHRVMGGRDISIVGAEYPLGLGSAVPYWNGGFYSVTTGALPATIQLSEMVITGQDDIIWVPFVTLAGTF
jgi:hypothetical protein